MIRAALALAGCAAALLLLAHEGRIGLETPVREVRPAYPHGATGSRSRSASGQQRDCTGSRHGFVCVGHANAARGITIAWVASSAAPSWLQPALSRVLVAVAENRTPEPLLAPPISDPSADLSRIDRIRGVGGVVVHRAGRQPPGRRHAARLPALV